MSTTLNVVLITTSGFSEEVVNFAQQFKFSKTFLLGLKVWGNMRLILVDLKKEKLYANQRGCSTRDVEEVLKDEEGNLLLSKSSISTLSAILW